MNPAEAWAAKVDRAANDPARIEKRKQLLRPCGPDCVCKQDGAITSELGLEDTE